MKTIKSKCLCAPLKHGEKIRKYLKEKKLLKDDLKINRDNKYIYFPIIDKINKKKLNYKIINKKFEIKEKNIYYKEKLKNIIPEDVFKNLPRSFDIIGDIILIRLDKSLHSYKKEIGLTLLETIKKAKVVCTIEPVKGELRTRKLEIIAGEKRTKTIHKEHGLTFEVDVKKTYFSPRLANERKRIANLVKKDEVVVDMFTGVAPFSIMIAKYSNPKIIYALDKNPYAIKYAKINVKKNKVLEKIQLIKADAKNSYKFVEEKANRIIMNLPFSAYKFFKHALDVSGNKCVIHYYDILKENEIDKRINYLKNIAFKKGFILDKIDVHKIKTYAPREFYIGIDITAKKKPM
ncbi:MAG: class I SAM-dependent methyltransferase [Thermoplasmatota archaeon]|jgi:tRNA (guanine37-N1)-methyltransferase